MDDSSNQKPTPSGLDRRDFLSASSLAMGAGVVASYGTLGVMAGGYLYPSGSQATAWLYVRQLKQFAVGESITYTGPTGSTIVIARQKPEDSVDSFVALSSVCPHLGCQVHWESKTESFFCPCHNGRFAPDGTATEGPPAKAGQDLSKFPLMIEDGLLFIEVPTESVTGGVGGHASASPTEHRSVPSRMLAEKTSMSRTERKEA